jgi:hypothetical protein
LITKIQYKSTSYNAELAFLINIDAPHMRPTCAPRLRATAKRLYESLAYNATLAFLVNIDADRGQGRCWRRSADRYTRRYPPVENPRSDRKNIMYNNHLPEKRENPTAASGDHKSFRVSSQKFPGFDPALTS